MLPDNLFPVELEPTRFASVPTSDGHRPLSWFLAIFSSAIFESAESGGSVPDRALSSRSRYKSFGVVNSSGGIEPES